MKNLVALIVLSLTYLSINAQIVPDEYEIKDTLDPQLRKGVFPKKKTKILDQLNISGYYRFVTNYRHLDEAYPSMSDIRNNVFVGDDSQIPQLSMNIYGALNNKTSFGTDFYIWSPMTGRGMVENVKGLNLGVSLYGNFSTKIGNFNVQTGGINWYMLSPFTFQTVRGYNRYSLFERNPWDPNTARISSRYEAFYSSGAMDQDQRWGQQAFQGLILTATELPQNFSGSFMYGKTQLNGGSAPLPNLSYGGRLAKNFGKNFVAFNSFNSKTYEDSTEANSIGFNIHTLQYDFTRKKNRFFGEIGGGRAYSTATEDDWGEAISLKYRRMLRKNQSLEFHYFRISPRVLNNNSVFINSAIAPEYFATNNSATQPVLPAVASAMTTLGQLTNNRQGIELNSQVNIGKRIKLSAGLGMASDLEKISSQLTYSHPVNALVLAHFWRWNFPTDVGPYGNLSRIYRSVYETVNLTDVDTAGKPLHLKRYSNIEINAKYKGKVANKIFYVFFLGQYGTAQRNWSPIPVFSEEAYLRTYYSQIESYLELNSKLVLSSYFGYERILGNYDTEVDKITLRPKNQTGTSFALGADIRMSRNVGLYLRQRWFDYKDTSFTLDKFRGFESTVEIKIFF